MTWGAGRCPALLETVSCLAKYTCAYLTPFYYVIVAGAGGAQDAFLPFYEKKITKKGQGIKQ